METIAGSIDSSAAACLGSLDDMRTVPAASSASTAPTQQSYEVFDMLIRQLNEQMTKWKEIVATDVPAYNILVKKQEVPALKVTQPNAGQ